MWSGVFAKNLPAVCQLASCWSARDATANPVIPPPAHAMLRRDFLHTLAAAAATASVPTALAATPRAFPLGLELYSVRTAMRADPEGTLAQVRAMGYDEVELLWSFGNFGRTAAQVRAALDATGLKAPACHLAPEALLTEWPRSLAMAHEIGQQYLIVPSLPAETNTSIDAWKRWADHFNRAGAEARAAGLWLALHNEPNHHKAIDGVIPYDVFLERTDPSVVRLQLDTGNMLMGGGDPFAYLARHKARYWSFHLKDVIADRTRDCDLGQGIFDFARFVREVGDFTGKPAFVEQEGSPDALASARANARYLRTVGY